MCAEGGVKLPENLPLNYLFFLIISVGAGRKGGHKGRARQYTSPEEIDAQLQAEKQKARVCICLDYVFTVVSPALQSMLYLQFMRNVSLIILSVITAWILNDCGWGDPKEWCSPVPHRSEARLVMQSVL